MPKDAKRVFFCVCIRDKCCMTIAYSFICIHRCILIYIERKSCIGVWYGNIWKYWYSNEFVYVFHMEMTLTLGTSLETLLDARAPSQHIMCANVFLDATPSSSKWKVKIQKLPLWQRQLTSYWVHDDGQNPAALYTLISCLTIATQIARWLVHYHPKKR